jgi:hypothetical protein
MAIVLVERFAWALLIRRDLVTRFRLARAKALAKKTPSSTLASEPAKWLFSWHLFIQVRWSVRSSVLSHAASVRFWDFAGCRIGHPLDKRVQKADIGFVSHPA